MVIFIGGTSCVGKTLISQRLTNETSIPYLSEDHVKMGMIRGIPDCGFCAVDADEVISAKLYPVIEGIARTAIENHQNLIIEGCYHPHEKVKKLMLEYPRDLAALWLSLSPEYLSENFESGLIAHRSDIEERSYPEERTLAEVIEENLSTKRLCKSFDLTLFEVTDDYEKNASEAVKYVMDRLKNS